MNYDDVVIGAGHNGLTAAAYLARAGRQGARPRGRRPRRGRRRLRPGVPRGGRAALALLLPRVAAAAAGDHRPRPRRAADPAPVLLVHPGARRTRPAACSSTTATPPRRAAGFARAHRRDAASMPPGSDFYGAHASAWPSGSSRPSSNRCAREDDVRRPGRRRRALGGAGAPSARRGARGDVRRRHACAASSPPTPSSAPSPTLRGDRPAPERLLPLPPHRRRHRRLGRPRRRAWAPSPTASPARPRRGRRDPHRDTRSSRSTRDGEVTWDGGVRAPPRRSSPRARPAVLNRLLAAAGARPGRRPRPTPEGAQLKVNMLLSRLPRLRDASVDPRGRLRRAPSTSTRATTQLAGRVCRRRAPGGCPQLPPCEIYCHSLSDRSILGPDLAATDAQTLTLFGLHLPARLFRGSAEEHDARQGPRAGPHPRVAQLGAGRTHPGRACSATPTAPTASRHGPRSSSRRDLGLPGGNIFHRSLQWPWAEQDVRGGHLGRRDPPPEGAHRGRRRAPRRWGQRHTRPQRGHVGARRLTTCSPAEHPGGAARTAPPF